MNAQNVGMAGTIIGNYDDSFTVLKTWLIAMSALHGTPGTAPMMLAQ